MLKKNDVTRLGECHLIHLINKEVRRVTLIVYYWPHRWSDKQQQGKNLVGDHNESDIKVRFRISIIFADF